MPETDEPARGIVTKPEEGFPSGIYSTLITGFSNDPFGALLSRFGCCALDADIRNKENSRKGAVNFRFGNFIMIKIDFINHLSSNNQKAHYKVNKAMNTILYFFRYFLFYIPLSCIEFH